MIPVVMAGGFGTRIRPLSANRPKPMLPVVNVPILERVLLHLAQHDMREAILLVYHDPAKIRDAFEEGGRLGMKLHYYQADQDYGTAGAVAHGADQVRSDRYLVVSGDVLCDFDLSATVAFHEKNRAAATIGLTHVPNPLQFGIVIIDGEGRVRRFLEKPTWGEVFSDTVNTGVYVLEASVLEQVPRHEAMDFSRELFPRLLASGAPLYGHVLDGYWRDIGDPESYLAAHADFFHGTLRIVPPGELRQIGGKPIWIEGDCEIDPSAEIRGTVVLGADCRIGAGVRLEDVVIGPGTIVGSGAEIRRTVVWDTARIGERARVEGSALGSRVVVGADSVVETGSVIADDTELGGEVRVKENVKIWPGKVVEDHAVVHSNLVYAQRWRTSAFDEGAVTGLTNLELTPEVAARLGAAYGTLLQPGSTVLTVRDAHPASRMLRRAFIGGVGSTGVHVVDLGMLPIPVMRHKLESFGEVGGVSFQQVQLVRGMTSIRFFDEYGLDISTSFAKSVERVFLREEFRRAQHQEIGVIFELPRIVDFYAESYLKSLNGRAVRERRFRLVVDYAHSASVAVLPRLLADLDCDVVTLNAHTEGVHEAMLAEEIARSQQRLGAIVTSLEADLGVWMFPGGERLAFVDRRGRVWSGMELVALVVAAVIAADLPRRGRAAGVRAIHLQAGAGRGRPPRPRHAVGSPRPHRGVPTPRRDLRLGGGGRPDLPGPAPRPRRPLRPGQAPRAPDPLQGDRGRPRGAGAGRGGGAGLPPLPHGAQGRGDAEVRGAGPGPRGLVPRRNPGPPRRGLGAAPPRPCRAPVPHPRRGLDAGGGHHHRRAVPAARGAPHQERLSGGWQSSPFSGTSTSRSTARPMAACTPPGCCCTAPAST